MSKFMSFFVVATLFAGCGGGKVFKEGYYKAEGDLAKRSYPLLAIKFEKKGGKEWIHSYEAVNSGQKQDDVGVSSIGTSVAIVGNRSYQGFITPNESGIHVVAKQLESSLSNEFEDFQKKGQVIEEYNLVPIEKKEAIEFVRSAKKVQKYGSKFTEAQEEACQGMFEMNCAELSPLK